MPPEIDVDIVEDQQVEDNQQEASTPQLSEAEQQAIEMGWKPKSEWSGEEDDFVSAKEFVRRKSFYDRISSQSKELKELRVTLDALKEHNKKIETYTRKQVMEELKQAKRDALESGDVEKVLEVDEAIIQYKLVEKDEAEKEKQVKEQPGEHPDFTAWKTRNKWYSTDPDLQDFANTIGVGYKNRNPDAGPEQVLSYVEKKVKEAYKDKFENPKRKQESAVETSSAGSVSKDTKGKYTPSDEEKAIAKKFVRQGVYKTENEYYAALAGMN
jgi:hypothetical protein